MVGLILRGDHKGPHGSVGMGAATQWGRGNTIAGEGRPRGRARWESSLRIEPGEPPSMEALKADLPHMILAGGSYELYSCNTFMLRSRWFTKQVRFRSSASPSSCKATRVLTAIGNKHSMRSNGLDLESYLVSLNCKFRTA